MSLSELPKGWKACPKTQPGPCHFLLIQAARGLQRRTGALPDIQGPWPSGRMEVQDRHAGTDISPCSPPGLLWQLRPSDVEVELLAHTRRVVSHDLEKETGLHTGWIQNGGLFIASNRQRLDEYKRLMSVGAPLPGLDGLEWVGAPPAGGGWGSMVQGGALTELGSIPAAALASWATWDE